MKSVCIRLPLDPDLVAGYGRALGLPDRKAALLALARAISVSRGWEAAPGAVLLVRASPVPLIAVMGCFDEAGEAWLTGQARALGTACGGLRLLSYEQVEEDCELLAARLRDRFSEDELRAARFRGIPRGGLIVLGLLAMALGLDQRQLAGSPGGEPLWIAVDDCAFSGTRFRGFLGELEAGKVAFAHLYSYPSLRSAILRQEPRVIACLNARDLEAPVSAEWSPEERRRWLAGSEVPPYWLGKTETLCFPWGEPDRSMWNPLYGQAQLAWRVVPPDRCLKNRAEAHAEAIPIQVHPDARGPLKPPPEVIGGELEGRTVLHNLETGDSVSLDSVAADVWRALLDLGDLEDAVGKLRGEYAVPGERLRHDVSELADELIARGFLEWDTAVPSATAARGRS